MYIIINDKQFPKKELIRLIKESRLQAIIHIRTTVQIGLKDAKEIIENLDKDSNYYDHVSVKKATIDVIANETVSIDLKNNKSQISNTTKKENKAGSHILKKDSGTNKKWIYFFVLIIGLIVLYFLRK